MSQQSQTFPMPEFGKQPNIRCIAVFIDVARSSQARSGGERDATSLNIARQLCELVDEKWADGQVEAPDTVRLFGDGLFCVWEYEVSEIVDDLCNLKTKLLGVLLEIVEASHREATMNLRIGIAQGSALKALIRMPDGDEVNEYFGPTINLASKLEKLAEPYGILMNADFREDLKEHTSKLSEVLYDDPLEPVRATKRTTISLFRTHSVGKLLGWTCLAWPGFAHAESDTSLHRRGITVLTHEGLSGKIDSLKVWPRGEDAVGDSFEVLIDDFDNIHRLYSEGQIKLAPKNSRQRLKNVVPDLAKRVSDRNFFKDTNDKQEEIFYFKPIRCGLNAIAVNEDAWSFVEEGSGRSTYGQILTDGAVIDGCRFGLYDNAWASLCVIADAFLRDGATKADLSSIYHVMDEDNWRAALGWLLYLQRKRQREFGAGERLFELYGSIEDASDALQEGDVNIFVGGGAWLGNPAIGSKEVRSFVPKSSWGYVWVEGAVVLAKAVKDDVDLESFKLDLQHTVLAKEYQDRLVNSGIEYGTTPVNPDSIREILAEREIRGNGAAATIEETRTIFRSQSIGGPILDSRCHLRRRPRMDHVRHWLDAWKLITEKLCR